MAKGKGTKSGKTATGSSGTSARLRKTYKQTPLGTAFPSIAAGIGATAGGQTGFGAASAMAAESLEVTRAAISKTGLSAAGVPALLNLLQLMDFATVEEALGSLRIMRQSFAEQFKLPNRAVESLIKSLEAKAQPLPDDDSGPLAFGLSPAPSSELPPAADFLLPLSALQTLPVAGDGGGIGAPAAGFGAIGAAPPGASAALGALGLPASVNLISQLPNPVRNQGQRQTCVAFSTLVAYEHYLSVTQGNNLDLSEQFLYWACVQRDGISHNPDTGTLIKASKLSLEQVGVCPEANWGYAANVIPGNAGHNPPPAGALSAASPLIPPKVLKVRPNSVEDFKFLLSTGRCITFGVPLWSAFWNNQAAIRTGRIKFFPGTNPDHGGHAMCIVGYQDDASNPLLGGGRFIVRNSHGLDFGSDQSNLYGAGNGTIAYDYIAKYGNWPAFNDIAIAFE